MLSTPFTVISHVIVILIIKRMKYSHEDYDEEEKIMMRRMTMILKLKKL